MVSNLGAAIMCSSFKWKYRHEWDPKIWYIFKLIFFAKQTDFIIIVNYIAYRINCLSYFIMKHW